MKVISQELINIGVNYEEYKKIIDDLLKDKKTTGDNQSTEYVEFTKLNVYRMHRIDLKLKLMDVLVDKLMQLQNKYVWLVFSEAWCGDAAQNLPILSKMSYVTPKINLRIIFRDEHKEEMQNYLTNGGMAIPKLVCLNADTLEEVFTWGPRPSEAQQIISDNTKIENPLNKEELHTKLHLWYAQNKYMNVQQELLELIDLHLS